MSVRVAVIGAGVMGADHARIIAEDLPGAALQVVCDADGARARSVADRCGIAFVETDPASAITRGDVDAIIVASPDETHAALTLSAIAAGKPVLCEKPLAPSVKDCLRVVGAETERGRPLVQVGFMRRFDPSYVEMRAALAEGEIGRALMMHNFHRNVESPGDWFTEEMAVANSASHEFDASRFVLGTEFAGIAAWRARRGDSAPAPVMMVLDTAEGQIVCIEINNAAAYGYDVRAELVGESGSVLLDAPVRARYNHDLRRSERYASDWRQRFAEAYRLQDRAWLRSIETGVPSLVAADAWDGYVAAAVGEAGTRALQEGSRIAIATEEMPAFYRATREVA